jgi:hypothetical protein
MSNCRKIHSNCPIAAHSHSRPEPESCGSHLKQVRCVALPQGVALAGVPLDGGESGGQVSLADFDLALNRLHLFQDFPNGMASAFGSDNDA